MCSTYTLSPQAIAPPPTSFTAATDPRRCTWVASFFHWLSQLVGQTAQVLHLSSHDFHCNHPRLSVISIESDSPRNWISVM